MFQLFISNTFFINGYLFERRVSLLNSALFVTSALNFTKFPVGREMEWFNLQHRKVDFVKFGIEKVEDKDYGNYKQVLNHDPILLKVKRGIRQMYKDLSLFMRKGTRWLSLTVYM